MKRLIAFVLMFVIVLGLCACSDTQNEEASPPSLRVGYSRIDITPKMGVGMGGYGDYATRRTNGILDSLYVTCIAFTESENMVLLYTIDNLCLAEATQATIRISVTNATGVPKTNIFFGATHTHSAPSIEYGDEESTAYKADVTAACVKAAKLALEDQAPTKLYQSKTLLEKMTFVRHYKTANGNYYGSNFGSSADSQTVGYATEADNEMILIKCDRGTDKKDILLVNWQAHPDHAGANGYTNVSADFPGAMRNKLEDSLNMHVAYFTGDSGNLNPFSRIPADNHNYSMTQYGEALADRAIQALKDLTPVEGSGIKTTQSTVRFNFDHSLDHMVKEAGQVQQLWNSEGRSAADTLAKSYGFSSVYHASAILRRIDYPATGTMQLNAFSICGIGFVGANCEMFSDSGLYIKENSPFETTFIITAQNGYMPSEAAYDYHSYEADTASYEKGSTERMEQEFVRLLEEIK